MRTSRARSIASEREAATARRRRAVTLLTDAGLAVDSSKDDVADLWRRVDADPTFAAGQRLYEARSWAMAELTEELFRRHVERGEVFVARDARRSSRAGPLAILVGEQLPSEESALRLALLVGDGDAAAHLVDQIRHADERSDPASAFRPGAPMVAGHEDGVQQQSASFHPTTGRCTSSRATCQPPSRSQSPTRIA